MLNLSLSLSLSLSQAAPKGDDSTTQLPVDEAKVAKAHERDQKRDLKRVDANSDGIVTSEEFLDVAHGYDKEEFAQFDKNKDGKLDHLEWEAWWEKYAKDDLEVDDADAIETHPSEEGEEEEQGQEDEF